jgi:hypothetical protein
MPKRPIALSKLIDALARLFVDIESSRLVVDRAEMDATVIAFDQRALFNWTNIVNEAIAQNKLRDLVTAADGMYPNVPELKNGLRDYEQWAAKNAEQPEVIQTLIDQPPPPLWDRMRRSFIGVALTIAAAFAAIGIVARQSQRLFYGLPSPRTHPFSDVQEWTYEGLKFIGRTLVVLIEYLTLNPLGLIAVLVAAGLVVYALVRWRKRMTVVYKPAVAVPLLMVLAIAKVFWYDVPTLKLDNVLTKSSYDMTSFDIPPLIQPRARTMWESVVCSRVGSLDDPRIRAMCGEAPPRVHLQNLYGRFLLDVLFTLALWSIGARVITKLILPSRNLAWNLPPIWRRIALGGAGIALAIGIIGLPYAYSRTARSMKPRKVCTDDAGCYFRLCVNRRECYAYVPPDIIERAGPEPRNAEITMDEDILQVSFTEQIGTQEVNPQDRANRFPGGM